MALKALKKILTGSLELNQIQSNFDALITQLNQLPFISGQLFDSTPSTTIPGRVVAGVSITTRGTTLYHNLGYVPAGYIVLNQNGAASIYQAATLPATPNPTSSYIILQSSANVTANVWVF